MNKDYSKKCIIGKPHKDISCDNCGAKIEVNTYRRFAVCPYCDTRHGTGDYIYRIIDWEESKYAHVRKWTDCPVCGSGNMYLGAERKSWKCPDCGYVLPDKDLKRMTLWFCEDCETYLNIQPGFETDTGSWKCTECGKVNCVTEKYVI